MRDNSFVIFILILAVLYILSPIDLIPDVIPVVRLVHDLTVGVGASDPPQVKNRRSVNTVGRFSQRH